MRQGPSIETRTPTKVKQERQPFLPNRQNLTSTLLSTKYLDFYKRYLNSNFFQYQKHKKKFRQNIL
jgi:hypothetical protein